MNTLTRLHIWLDMEVSVDHILATHIYVYSSVGPTGQIIPLVLIFKIDKK